MIIPFDGLITIDSEGQVDVSTQAARTLLLQTEDWEEVGVSIIPVSGEEKSEEEQVISSIKKMSMLDMIALAVGAEYPEAEYAKFKNKDKLMQGYLIKKYNDLKLETDLAEEDKQTVEEPEVPAEKIEEVK